MKCYWILIILQHRKPQRYHLSYFCASCCLCPYVSLGSQSDDVDADIIPLVSLPSQWVTSGRMAWAFARDVSFQSISISFIRPNRNSEWRSFLRILFQSGSKIRVSRANHRCCVHICLALRLALSCLHYRIQLNHHLCRSLPERHLHGASGHSPRSRSSTTSAAKVSEPWCLWWRVQWLLRPLDCGAWSRRVYASIDTCQYGNNELY